MTPARRAGQRELAPRAVTAAREPYELQMERLAALPGGIITGLAFSPDFERDGVLLAASPVQLHRSDDWGRTWRSAAGDLGRVLVYSVTVTPDFGRSGIAFAAAEQGLLVSSSHGSSWRAATAWPAGLTPSTLGVSPAFDRDHTLYAGTLEAGVWASPDGGRSWDRRSFRLEGDEVREIAISPAFPRDETILAATDCGVYRSPNAGRAWTAVRGAEGVDAQCLLLSPGFGEDGLAWIGTGAGLLISEDGGRSCRPVRAFPPEPVAALARSPIFNRDRLVLAASPSALFRSEDGGTTWKRLGDSPPQALCLAICAAPGGGLLGFAGTAGGGLFRSEPGGPAWKEASTGLDARLASCLTAAVGPAGEAAIHVAGLGEGVTASRDGGASWTPASKGLESMDVDSLLAAPGDDGRTQLASLAGGAVYFAREPAARWQLALREPDDTLGALALSRDFERDGAAIAAGERLYVTADAGRTWETRRLPAGRHRAVGLAFPGSSASAGAILVATALEGEPAAVQCFISNDAGRSWDKILSRRSAGPVADLMAPDSLGTSDSFFLACRGGLFVGTARAAGRPTRGRRLLAGTGAVALGLAISCEYARDRALFAATSGGIYRSADRGRSWARLAASFDGLPVLRVASSACRTGSGTIFALTLGGAVWRVEGRRAG